MRQLELDLLALNPLQQKDIWSGLFWKVLSTGLFTPIIC